MARDYIRPNISADDLVLLQGGRRVVINPTHDDALNILNKVQTRCRKNVLSSEEVISAWEEFEIGQNLSVLAGKWTCPHSFHFGLQGTVFQIVKFRKVLLG